MNDDELWDAARVGDSFASLPEPTGLVCGQSTTVQDASRPVICCRHEGHRGQHVAVARWNGVIAVWNRQYRGAVAMRDDQGSGRRLAIGSETGRPIPSSQSRVGPAGPGEAVEAECPQDQGEPCNTAPATTLDGVGLIAAERERQIEAEGWTPAHDDEHRRGELADAAALYIAQVQYGQHGDSLLGWRTPAHRWVKPCDRQRALIKAGALIAAELDRIARGSS